MKTNYQEQQLMLEGANSPLFTRSAITKHQKAKFLYKLINFHLSVTKLTQQLLKGVMKC